MNCVPAILTAQDAYLVTNDSNETEADQQEASSSEVHSCSICFEPYDQDVVVPRILTACGHTFCEPCLSSLLRLLPAATNKKTGGGGKTLGCPVCKTANAVPGGSPTKLPKNFAIFE